MTAPSQRSATRRRRTPATRRRAARGQRSDGTREAILQAAVELYAERGVRGTGLIAIGERAGVHHATVLYHFGTSRDLLLAVLAERDRRLLEFSRVGRQAGGLEGLLGFASVARFNLAHPLWAKLFTVLQVENLDADADVHAYFVERRRSVHARIVKRLREARRRGQIRRDVAVGATADAILAFAAGAQIQALLDPEQVDLIALHERFTRMLLRDLTRGVGAA